MSWIPFLQVLLTVIVVTFCILIIQSFVTAGRHQHSVDRLAELEAECELRKAQAELETRRQENGHGE